jgi:hypothetical protein
MRVAMGSRFLGHLLSLLMGLVFLIAARPAGGEVPVPSPASPQSAQTILLAGQSTTWLDLPEPPYNAAITVKSKLEQAGFRVTFDQTQPHHYVLAMTYLETRGRAYGTLEYGTNISLEFSVWRVVTGKPQKLWTRTIESSTSWPVPVGSHYWDAVQNLEENPYYYYIGELVQGVVTTQEDAGAVFARVLRQQKLGETTYESGGFQAPGHVVANQGARLNAIRELGRLKDRRALSTLWELVEQGRRSDDSSDVTQRITALAAIGEIGDPTASDRLSRLYETETDADMRAVLEQAMARIREQQSSDGSSK